jgi:hypothetical protein
LVWPIADLVGPMIGCLFSTRLAAGARTGGTMVVAGSPSHKSVSPRQPNGPDPPTLSLPRRDFARVARL